MQVALQSRIVAVAWVFTKGMTVASVKSTTNSDSFWFKEYHGYLHSRE